MKRRFFEISVLTFILVLGLAPVAYAVDANAQASPAVSTTVHVQDYGWLDPVVSDVTAGGALGTEAFAGTEGESKRVEAFEMELGLAGTAYAGTDSHISYNTHIQNQGWQQPVWSDPTTWVADGAQSGTTGSGLRCEAIQIALTGDIAAHYDVYYRVHVQDYGWLCWAKDGEVAGTAGYAKRMEAVQVILVAEGGTPPADPGGAVGPYLRESLVSYTAHVQDYGWLDPVADGEEAGTTGEGLRVEALTVALANQDHPGSIAYNAHVQNVGWQCDTEDASIWFSDGQEVGTDGQSLRVEAMQIALTGEMADHYDVYYRVHAQNIGWLGWAKDGQEAGTAGLALRLEAVEVVLVEKGGKAPGSTARPYVEGADYYEGSGIVGYAHVSNVEDTAPVDAGETLGFPNEGKSIEALYIKLTNTTPTALAGGVSYRVYTSDEGWFDWVADYEEAGTTGESLSIQALQMTLNGEIASFYDVYYRAHTQTTGWLGWARSGETAGSLGLDIPVDAVEFCLCLKSNGAPGSTADREFGGYAIMGASTVAAEQMVAYYNDIHGGDYPASVLATGGAPNIETFCNILCEEAAVEGVRAEVVFAQMTNETNWLQFTGRVPVTAFNFCGLGAIDSDETAWNTFPDVRTGLRAQVQHLKAYASYDALVNPCVDIRFGYVTRGCAPTVELLSGKWATGPAYGQKLLRHITELRGY